MNISCREEARAITSLRRRRLMRALGVYGDAEGRHGIEIADLRCRV